MTNRDVERTPDVRRRAPLSVLGVSADRVLDRYLAIANVYFGFNRNEILVPLAPDLVCTQSVETIYKPIRSVGRIAEHDDWLCEVITAVEEVRVVHDEPIVDLDSRLAFEILMNYGRIEQLSRSRFNKINHLRSKREEEEEKGQEKGWEQD